MRTSAPPVGRRFHLRASIQNQLPGTWAYTNDDCARVWKVPLAPAEVRQPLMSSIPTLLISGRSIPWHRSTLPQSVAAGLSKATLISIPGVGHSMIPSFTVCSTGLRLIPQRSEQTRHIMCRPAEAAALHGV